MLLKTQTLTNTKIMSFKTTLLTMALLISAIVYSQESEFTGKIIDEKTNKTIDYVYILDSLNKVISVTDEFGFFKFKNSDSIKNLKIFKYGYSEKKILKKNLKDTIYLNPKIIVLDEVVLSSPKKNISTFYKFYFRTYDFKNEIKRRYIDGIVQFEYNKKKNKVEPKILEYRSFSNEKIMESEAKGIIRLQYEGTGIPSFKLRSILEMIKEFKDYDISKEESGYTIFDKLNKVGTIFVNDDWTKEKRATIIEKNELGKIAKKMGASGKVLFKAEEEHYNSNDNYNSLSYRKIIEKTLFKRKREKEFSTYETNSEIFLLESKKEPFQEDDVKLKRDKSNYKTKYWLENKIISEINDKIFYQDLKAMKNK
jgi:hypothetical protein